MTDRDFFARLREDMMQTRQRRFQYQLAKVASIGSIMGISGLGVVRGATLFFYAVPFIAVAFDCFVLSESFTLRRMSAFIRENAHAVDEAELNWECFVKANPDRFSAIANFIVTVAIAAGSFLVLMITAPSPLGWLERLPNLLWTASVVVAVVGIRFIEARMARRVWQSGKKDKRG